jgi:hypothetical protein
MLALPPVFYFVLPLAVDNTMAHLRPESYSAKPTKNWVVRLT